MSINKFFQETTIKVKKNKYVTIKELCSKIKTKIDIDPYYDKVIIKCLIKRVSDYTWCSFITVTDVKIKSKYAPNICVMIKRNIYNNDIKENDVVIFTGKISLDERRCELKLHAYKYILDVPQISNFDKIRDKLEKDNILQIAKKDIPEIITNIAIISSENAAGLKDCLNILQKGNCCNIYFYHSVVQGQDVEVGITENIRIINKSDKIDVILIIRGGGSKSDLEWFDNYNIAKGVKNSRIPIICGIGHEIDLTILDLVADYSCTTPTQVGQFILEKLLRRTLIMTKIETLYNNLINQFNEKMKICNSYIITGNNIIQSNLKHKLSNTINNYNNKLYSVEYIIYKINNMIQNGLDKYNSFQNLLLKYDNILEKNIILIHKKQENITKIINKYGAIQIYDKKKHIHSRNSLIKAIKNNTNKKLIKFKFVDGVISLNQIISLNNKYG